MGTLSLWHWAIVLILLAGLFGLGRKSGAASLRFGATTFVTGVATSVLAVLILNAIVFGGVDRVLDRIGDLLTNNLIGFLSSGLEWLGLGFILRALRPPRGGFDWIIRIAAVGFVLPLLSAVLSIGLRIATQDSATPALLVYYSNPAAWFAFLQQAPVAISVFLRAALLVRLAARPSIQTAAWSPGPAAGHGPDQVTRILCGQAILGGPAFRRGVLEFFKDRWTAPAPEFGLDAELLVNVCRSAEDEEERYTWIYTGLALTVLLVAISPILGIFCFLVLTAIARYRQVRAHRALARTFSVSAFNRETASDRFSRTLDPETAAALPRPEQNLVVYRGFMPFVGAGIDLGGWSFATSTDRPQVAGDERKIRTFTVAELYRAIEAGIEEGQIPGLRCRDLFFVRGLDVRNMSAILPDLAERPSQRIGDDLAKLYFEQQNTLVRDYKSIQVFDWGGELVASYFLHCSLHPTSLMVEFKRFLLPPLRDNLRQVDRLGPDRFWTKVEQFGAALLVGPLLAVFSPFAAFAKILEAMGERVHDLFWSEERKARERRRRAEDDLSYDYGAETSLRAHYAQTNFLHYFQKVDADFYNKVVERKLLDVIERFLDEHGIDTTDIRERQTTILNSGILIQGGDLRAESLAVGEGARASKVENRTPARPKETVS